MRTKTGQTFGVIIVWCIFALAIVGCATVNKGPGMEEQGPTAEVQSEPQMGTGPVEWEVAKFEGVKTPDYHVHTVKWHGETLSYIAKWYTGAFKNWKVLAKVNPTLNPNRIYKGNQIIIPEGVLRTRNPLPKNFIAQLAPKTTKKKTSVKSPHHPEEENALPLFGPK